MPKYPQIVNNMLTQEQFALIRLLLDAGLQLKNLLLYLHAMVC